MDTSLPPSYSGVPDAWQLAVQSHLASLTPVDRAKFKAPATADDCLNLITDSRRVRKFSRVLSAIRPVIEPLKRFENVIDVVVQTNGGLGSPIWGPIKLAVMVAINHLETLEKLARILQRIVASLERYSNYEILFKNSLNTQRAIGALYGDLIDLCARIVRFHSRPSITAVFVTFDKEFEQVSDNITHHSTEIDWAANAANIEEAKKARGLEDESRQTQIRVDIQRWLSPADVHDDQHRHEDERMDHSCDWILETKALQEFLSSRSSGMFRIGSAPGSGKSTLAAFLIRHITQSITGDVLYFFCKDTDEKRKQPFQVLRTLISQFLNRDPTLYPWFETLYQQSGQKTATSFAKLNEYLQASFSNTSKQMIYIVKYALDECEKATELINSLTQALKECKT